jgi:hypothetical protein
MEAAADVKENVLPSDQHLVTTQKTAEFLQICVIGL